MSYTREEAATELCDSLATGVNPADMDPDQVFEWAQFAYDAACQITNSYEIAGYAGIEHGFDQGPWETKPWCACSFATSSDRDFHLRKMGHGL